MQNVHSLNSKLARELATSQVFSTRFYEDFMITWHALTFIQSVRGRILRNDWKNGILQWTLQLYVLFELKQKTEHMPLD